MKQILEWDECEIADYEAKRLVEDSDCDFTDEDKARENLYEDSFFWSDEWESFCDDLTYTMEEITKRNEYKDMWKASVEGFGWRNLDGEQTFQAETAAELLSAVLPKTDCTFKIFRERNKLKIQNWHHDSPMGNEFYYIQPMTKKEVEEDEFY